ncbi:dipeptidyl peptidase 4 [Misgurnus anguillicaudatus]|uniref:dipeptidyl peptidase 4 n=1 Tax=Misgurnus anguillicaudatus TaxID=75329 RepID=UPI003CCF58F6
MKEIGKWILAALGIAVTVVLIVVPTVIYLNEDKAQPQKTFTLEDYFNNTARSKSYNLRWVSDDEYLHKTGDGSVFLINAVTGSESEFLNPQTFARVAASDYMVSADRKYVCFVSNYTKLWRHSYTASYSIYDLASNAFINADIPHEIQYLAWSPTGHKLAYVWKYNVYVKETPTSPPYQVTNNGAYNLILNGIPDWVYEEEMFSTNFALWWSPNGRFVAYAQFNDSEVHSIEYSWYGNGQYPETVFIPYPKPGTPNPIVKLFVLDTNTHNISEVVVPSDVGAGDHYLSTVTWATDERIVVQWQKRTQSYVALKSYKFNDGKWSEDLLNQIITSSTGWVGRFSPDEPVFRPDGESCYYILSDGEGFKHLVYFKDADKTFLTSGKWEVVSILKVTEDAVYYVSNQHNSHPGQRNVYKITINGASHSEPVCLTCTLNEDRCKYNSALFSHKGTYYRMDCSGPGPPLYTLRNSRDGSEVRVLEDNKDLEGILQEIAMPLVTHNTLKIGDFDLWYQMTLPPKFDKSKKYPLLIDVYAGPCSQKSDLRFRVGWSTYWASTENVIVASFDGRGSGYQGDKIMHSIYKRLGTYEVEDQITAAREFIKMGFIDKDRIAIWGWSYGGYVTSMVLGAGSEVFKCGMAVAPVSKWEYYDSIYTERYMLTPTENQDFYDNSTVTGRAKNFKSVQYLLVHGTADDNVHFQQAAQISNALVDEQVDFDAMWYTDKDHGLGGSANKHVYTHMTHFLKNCFT